MISIRRHVLTGKTALWFAMGGMARFVVVPDNPVVSVIVGDVMSTTISVLHSPESKKTDKTVGTPVPSTETMVSLAAFMAGWLCGHTVVAQRLEGDVANLSPKMLFGLHVALFFAVVVAVARYVKW